MMRPEAPAPAVLGRPVASSSATASADADPSTMFGHLPSPSTHTGHSHGHQSQLPTPSFYVQSHTPVLRPEPDLVMDNLYLGDRKDAYSGAKTITRLGITHVLTVTMLNDLKEYRRRFPSYVKCLVVSVLDDNSENISQYFPATNAFIDQGRKEGCVLVHCVWGISRSAAFVIAYVMHNKLINFRAAFQLVHRARPIIAPNMGFRSQLQVYGFELLAVQFTIHYVTRFGQQLHLVASNQQPGPWRMTDANKMTWEEGGFWRITLPTFRTRFEYKYVVENGDGSILWESCPNRVYDGSRRFVRDFWDDVGYAVTGPACEAAASVNN